jgi:leucyl-tRNA synthetase
MYRYFDPTIDTAFMNKDIGKKWLPVDQYTGGVEHAILHLLYMRFMTKALRDLGELWFDEPVKRFRYQGTIVFKGRKMSKSRGNVQTPDEYVKRYGADTLRLFMMFMGPWVDGADWDASGIEGVHRFLRRVWEMALAEPQPSGPRDVDLDREVQRAIKRVTEDLGTYAFNTAVAAMMELSNALQKASGPSRDAGVATLILLLAPFAPHMTEELWHRRGGAGSVHRQSWPAFDAKLAAASTVTIVVQVNGKVRDRIDAPAGKSEAELERLALASPKVQAALNGSKPAKVIVVADRLVNLVTKGPQERVTK